MERILFYDKKLSDIMSNDNLVTQDRLHELSVLLSDMAVEFSVPLFPSDEYRETFMEVMAVFDKIVHESAKIKYNTFNKS